MIDRFDWPTTLDYRVDLVDVSPMKCRICGAASVCTRATSTRTHWRCTSTGCVGGHFVDINGPSGLGVAS